MSLTQKLANATASASTRQCVSVPIAKGASCSTRTPVLLRQFGKCAGANIRCERSVCSAAAEGQGVKEAAVSDESDWVPVCLPEELPKGVRKEVEIDGRQVLLFWYRNQIYAIQGRSPAEGAYSEGFIKAKFTQDFAIECPATGSLFSLKDGSILSWYPNNTVLRLLTPQDTVRPMEIYPIKMTQKAIFVDVTQSGQAARLEGRGGAGTSLENNNVFSVNPTVYFEGMDPAKEEASVYQASTRPEALNPAVVVVGTVALGAFAISGSAICVYLENPYLLGFFWLVLGGSVGLAGFKYVNRDTK